jgi:hypothetical protein
LARIGAAATAALLVLGATALAEEPQTANNPTNGQALLAATIWRAPDTPGREPYVALALQQAEKARRDLQGALRMPGDPAAMSKQVAGALHALDPQYGAAEGPPDYGARLAMQHAMEGLHANLRQVATDERLVQAVASLASAEGNVDAAIDLGRAALAMPSEQMTWQGARAMLMALGRAIDGWDRDADGAIRWQRGEAGLMSAFEAVRDYQGGPETSSR